MALSRPKEDFRLLCAPDDEAILTTAFGVVCGHGLAGRRVAVASGSLPIEGGRKRPVKDVADAHDLKVQRCFSTAAPSKGAHVLENEADAGLKALKVTCGKVTCCCQADTGHWSRSDSVLQTLQFQSVRRLYGAPLL